MKLGSAKDGASKSGGLAWLASVLMAFSITPAALAELVQSRESGVVVGPAAPTTNRTLAANSAESIAIPRRAPASSPPGVSAPSSAGEPFSVSRIALALLFVLAAIFGLQWLGRRFFRLPAVAGSGGAVQVLSRSMLAPRQQLMLIQVGRRIVVVANCGAQVNSLCEITDPDEVAALHSQLRQRPAELGAKSFTSLFRRANTEFDASATAPSVNPIEEAAASESSESRDKADVDLTATQEELGGLMAKVRELSQQFRST